MRKEPEIAPPEGSNRPTLAMDANWERAIKHGDVEAVKDHLRSGVDINALDRYGQTALMLAAHHGHEQIVELLVAQGADLNVTAKYTLSALMLAVVAGQASIARMLARTGADLSIKGSGAPGFAGKSAYDLAVERRMEELYQDLKPN
jgi:ankyrin repeat protein